MGSKLLNIIIKIWTVIAPLVFILTIVNMNVSHSEEVEKYKTEIETYKIQIAIYKGQAEAAQKTLADEKAKPPIVVTETKTKTEIAYVPKETIIYKDPVTGETVTKKEAADVDFNVTPPQIGVRYNGKDYNLAGITGETHKFDQGKLVGEISTAATLDVTKLVDREVACRLADQEKDISLGGYITNKGFVGSIGLIRGDREYKIIGKVPRIKEFYGAGVEVKF